MSIFNFRKAIEIKGELPGQKNLKAQTYYLY